MSGKSLDDLGLRDEALPEQDLTDLPEFGGYTPPPQPGSYGFRLPPRDLLRKAFDAFDTTIDGRAVQRIKVIFDDDAPLVITRSAQWPDRLNTPFTTRLSNAERKRGKKDGDGPVVSDLDYLQSALGFTTRAKTNKETVERLISKAGEEFDADITYSWKCDDNRPMYYMDAQGARQQHPTSKGCGQKYYQKDVAKAADGTTPLEITCSSCGALVRAFANLDRIRAAGASK